MSIAASIAAPEPRLADYGPGIGAALSFSAADVLIKVVFASGMDVLSLITLRGILVTGPQLVGGGVMVASLCGYNLSRRGGRRRM